jgi:DHA3 family tetracycline resistance protein-like MFS transporter
VRRLRPATVYLIYETAGGFMFRLMATVYTVFIVVRLDPTPFQLLMLGTVLEGTYLLFELPTGVVADTMGRRISVVIGVLGTGVAFVVLGLAGTYLMAVVSQVMFGIFATFTSGADVAWLTDEIGEEAARPLYVRAEQWYHVGALVAIAASVALASIDLRLPVVLSGVGFIALGVFLAIAMREEGFTRRARPEGERIHRTLVGTLKDGAREVRGHPVLWLILVTAAIHGASTEGFDRLSDFHLLKDIGLPAIGGLNRVVWFGILDGVGMLLGLGALSILKRRSHLRGHAAVARILAVIDLLLVLGVVAFGVVGAFWAAVLAFWIVGALRSVRDPVFTAWVNQGLDPATRATVNSMGTQSDAIGQTVGGPPLGIIASAISVPAALVVSGLLRLPTLALYARAIRRGSVGTLAPDEIDEELTLDEAHEAEELQLPEIPGD